MATYQKEGHLLKHEFISNMRGNVQNRVNKLFISTQVMNNFYKDVHNQYVLKTF
jgi:hypothetical protein